MVIGSPLLPPVVLTPPVLALNMKIMISQMTFSPLCPIIKPIGWIKIITLDVNPLCVGSGSFGALYWLPQDQEDAVSAGTYYYVVTAVNINGNESGYSNEASISVGGGPAPKPLSPYAETLSGSKAFDLFQNYPSY